MWSISKPTKTPWNYTRHLYVPFLNCDSTCFHLLKYRNSGWSQSLKMTATETVQDYLVLSCSCPFAFPVSLVTGVHCLFFFFWYFRDGSYMNMGLLLIWFLIVFFLYIKMVFCIIGTGLGSSQFPVVGKTWNGMAIFHILKQGCHKSVWFLHCSSGTVAMKF